MADIATSILKVGSNRLILQDAEARTKINDMYITDTASGAIASFPDGAAMPVKSLTVDIEPVQDLHGQANPYPAGGGKNLTPYDTPLNVSAEASVQPVLFTVNLESGVAYTFSCKQSVSIPTSERNTLIIKDPNGRNHYEAAVPNYNPTNLRHVYTYTPSESGVHEVRMWDVTPSVDVTYTEWQVEKGSAFTSYAPYSNICPISGHTSATVTRTGKNLLSDSTLYNGMLYNPAIGSTFGTATSSSATKVSDGVYHISADQWGYTRCGMLSGKLPSGIAMTVSASLGDYNGIVVAALDKNLVVTRLIEVSQNTSARTVTTNITLSDGECYVGVTFYCNKPNTVATNGTTVSYPQLEIGSTASDWVPYTADTYTIDLDGTRYGGTLDVTTGVLTVTDANIASYNGETLPSTWISDRDVYASGTTPTAGAQVVYKLATPTTVQLTANEIKTVLGQNNIWNDCGDTTVEYRADTKLYINKMLNA